MEVKGLRYQKALDRFCSQLPGNANVLEILPGRGEYTEVFLNAGHNVSVVAETNYLEKHLLKSDRLRIVPNSVEDALVPFRTMHGIWGNQYFSGLRRADLPLHLSRVWDWILPKGVMYLSLYEGEGDVIIKEGVSGVNRIRRKTFYRPKEADAILVRAGYETVQAWRENINEQTIIHIFCLKNTI